MYRIGKVVSTIYLPEIFNDLLRNRYSLHIKKKLNLEKKFRNLNATAVKHSFIIKTQKTNAVYLKA